MGILRLGNRRRLWRTALGTLLALGLLGLLWSRVSLTEITEVAARISPLALFLASFFVLATNVLRALRFRILLSEYNPSMPSLAATVVACNSLSNLLPARLGELSYPVLFRHRWGVPYGTGASTLVVARFFDAIGASAVFIASAAFAPAIPQMVRPVLHVLFLLLLAGLVLASVMISLLPRWRPGARLASVGDRFPSSWSGPLGNLYSFALEATKMFRSVTSRTTLASLLITSATIWVCWHLAYFVLIADLDIPLDIASAFTAQSLLLVASTLPIQSLGGFGSFEATWTAAFLLFGVPEALAIASGVVVHLVLLAFQLFLGLIAFVTMRVGNLSSLARSTGESAR